MQNLNKLIVENKALQNENEALKAENAKVKQRISQLDENAVRRVTVQKDAVIESLNTQLVSKNDDITRLPWNPVRIQNAGVRTILIQKDIIYADNSLFGQSCFRPDTTTAYVIGRSSI